LKKITVQPTIHDLKPPPEKEMEVAFTIRLPLSLYQELTKATDNTPYDKKFIVRKALEAFLK